MKEGKLIRMPEPMLGRPMRTRRKDGTERRGVLVDADRRGLVFRVGDREHIERWEDLDGAVFTDSEGSR